MALLLRVHRRITVQVATEVVIQVETVTSCKDHTQRYTKLKI